MAADERDEQDDDNALTRVAVYLNVSDEDLAKSPPYTLARQQERLCAYIADQPGWRFAYGYTDYGDGLWREGDTLERVLSDTKDNNYDVLLVDSQERIAWTFDVWQRVRDEFGAAGVTMWFVTSPAGFGR